MTTIFRSLGGSISRVLGVGLAVAVTSTSLSAQTGRITGQAVAAETGMPLTGAEIRIVGTSIRTITNTNGRYLITQAPVGSQTLQLTFLGRETVTAEVDVSADQVAMLDFSAPVAPLALQGIEVLGVRAMTQARALSEQQNAANIINVVASDQIGRYPDASAPEALQRIPGITVERDQGEGRYVNIRGSTSDFTAVSLNGAVAPSPEGDNRRVALDAVSVDILESIEVAKALTPDMDAQGIGGAVNLVTRKAPENTLAQLDLGGGYAPIRAQPAYEGSLLLGRRFGEDQKFGALVLGSYSFRDFGSDDIEPDWDFGDAGTSDDVLAEFETRHYSLTRQRLSATASLDYRFTETSEIQFTGTYTEHEDTEQRRRMVHVLEDGEMEFNHKNRLETLSIASGSLDGNHLLGAVQLDWGASFARAGEDTPYDTEMIFAQEDVTFAPDISVPTRVLPNPTSPGAYDGTYDFDAIEPGSSETFDTNLGGYFDLEIPYQLGSVASGGLKFGFLVRDKSKDQNVEEFAYELADGDLTLDEIAEIFDDFKDFQPGSEYDFSPISTTPEQVEFFVDDRRDELEEERNVEADTEDFDLNERVIAGYVMTELNLTDRLMILPGIRYEYTDYTGDGFSFDPDTETLTPTTQENSYGNVFPHVHARYRIAQRTNLRAAYSTAIARPNYFDLIPYRIRDDEDRELGNPELDPTTANNFDLLIEHYDQRIGVLSAGVFYKSLTDPIYTFISDNELGGEDEQPRNGASADVFGFELAVQQQLRFLPGFLSGFGFYGNYTFTDSEATLADGRVATFAGQADHAFNAALSYERSGFSGQVGFNFRDSYIDGYGGEEAEDEFVGSRHQLDFSASYRINASGTVYVELLNLTNQPFVLYQGMEDRERQREFYRAWGTIGVRLTR